MNWCSLAIKQGHWHPKVEALTVPKYPAHNPVTNPTIREKEWGNWTPFRKQGFKASQVEEFFRLFEDPDQSRTKRQTCRREGHPAHPGRPRTICLSENTERLWISAMLWVVWQRSQTQGSAMRPRSISTWAVWAHTWHWKKASCISGMSWDVLITMPLMAMSWSMSARRRERSDCPLATALSSVSCGISLGWIPAKAGLGLLSSTEESYLQAQRYLVMAGLTGRHCGQGMNISLATFRSGLECPSCVQSALLSTPTNLWLFLPESPIQ